MSRRGATATVATFPEMGYEAGAAFRSGSLYITSGSSGGANIWKYDLSTNETTLFSNSAPRASTLEYEPHSDVFYFVSEDAWLRKISAAGAISDVALLTSTSQRNFAVEPSGAAAYFRASTTVYRVDVRTGVSEAFVNGLSSSNTSGDLVFGDLVFGPSSDGSGGGSLYIADGLSILEVAGFSETPPPPPPIAPELVVEQPAGTELLRGASGVIAWGGVTGSLPLEAQSGVTAIGAGNAHILAVKNGGVIAWGRSSEGETAVPVAARSGVVAVAGGAYHSVALKSDGSVIAWGDNTNGQSTVPAAAQSDVVAIAAGRYHTLALRRNGGVIGWGSNFNGETTIPPATQSRVQAIAAGGYQSVALEIGAPSTAFGSQLAGTTGATKSFIVKNTGTGPLMLTSVGVTVENAGDFPVNTNGLPASVPAGGETTFSVSFTPSGVGPRATTLRIVSDDADESPFDIHLTGAGVNNLPTLAIAAPDTAEEDAAVSFTFTATDADAADQAAGFAWNINWGAGSAADAVPSGTASPLARADTFANPGTYTVTGTVTDANGGTSPPASHTITIRDVTPPVFTSVSPNRLIEATSTNGALVSYAAATATDNSRAALAIASSQESGTLFPFGTTVVMVTARDAANNVAATSFNVTVQDTAGPVVTVPASPIVAEATSSGGATVSFAVTARDAVDGPVPATASPASGSVFALGDTTVNVTATDSRGNVGTGSFVVRVRDTTKPVITTPADLTVTTTSASGTAVTFEVSATDLVSGTVSAVATPASGSTFPVGSTTVTVTATDGAGNTQTASFTVTVRNMSPVVTVDSQGGAGAFSPTGSFIVERGRHTATLLANGKVLAAGDGGNGSIPRH